jgi:hypothetical protein
MNINVIQESILIESILDGCDMYGENFSRVLTQNLTFENKERIVNLVIEFARVHAGDFVVDPENIEFQEDVFDTAISKLYLMELVKGGFKPSFRATQLANIGAKRIKYGEGLSQRASNQITAGRNRLLGSGDKSVGFSLRAAKIRAGAGQYGAAAGNVARAGYQAGRGAMSIAGGGIRKGFANYLTSSGEKFKNRPQAEENRYNRRLAADAAIQKMKDEQNKTA